MDIEYSTKNDELQIWYKDIWITLKKDGRVDVWDVKKHKSLYDGKLESLFLSPAEIIERSRECSA